MISEAKIVLSRESDQVYPSEFESAVEKAFEHSDPAEVDSIEIDFTGVNYLDIVAVLNISSFIQNIRKKNPVGKLLITLPDNERIYFFIKQWKIDDAFTKAAGVSNFKDLLTDDSKPVYQKYFDSNEHTSKQDSNVIENYGNISELPEINFKYYGLCANKFFGVRSFDIQNPTSGSIDTGIINEEVSRWDVGDIKEVLNYTLRDIDGHRKEGYLPSNVIFECLTNALRHPNGNLLQIASRHISQNVLKNFNKPHFTLVFWDNGQCMIDVLKGGYEKFNSVRAELPFNNDLSYPHFQVRIKDDKRLIHETWVDSRIGPDEKFASSHYDYYWFLATFFPGVSSDPKGLTRLPNTGLKSPQISNSSIYHNPGMGLYLLLNTVVDVFNGKIAVRSGEYLMTIQKPTESKQKKYEYAATIKRVSSKVPKFEGNLIAVHLPLWRKNQ